MTGMPPIAAVQSVAIGSIRASGTQSRKNLDSKTVSDIREDIRDSNPITPIVLFFDGENHWIGDGYHRVEAHRKEKRDVIQAEMRSGSKDDALRFNIESNASADKTRWTNADKRNAVTLLLQSYGDIEITRARAQEIATLCRASHWLVETIAGELYRQNLPSTDVDSKSIAAQGVTTKDLPEDRINIQEENDVKTPTSPPKIPAGRRSLEMIERDKQVALLAADGHSQADIARQLKVSTGTISDSFRRQKLTQETANPLVKVLERAQLCSAEWEQVSSLLVSGSGAAAKWHTATREQKKEVIGHIKDAIRFQTDFINRLNKEAKG